MATFNELHRAGHRSGNIRKALRTVAFIGRRSEVDPPLSLIEGPGDLVDLTSEGFEYVGSVTVDGYNFEREESNSEVESQGFLTPTREDPESLTRTVTFTVQEVQKRHLKEFIDGARYDDIVVDENGQVVVEQPEFPEHDYWVLVIIAFDGVTGDEYLDAKVLPNIKVSSVSGEQWGGDGERNREITATVYADDELEVPEIDIMGGEAFARNAEELGYTVSGS